MGLLSNRVDEKSLKPGDHIYSWRTAYVYAHHGIYIGNGQVVHFAASRSGILSQDRPRPPSRVLYRFEYSVTPAHFLATARGGTCTITVSDGDDVVVHQAKYLLMNGFGCYNVFRNNYVLELLETPAVAR